MNLWKHLERMPSTNVRIAASVFMALCTGFRVVILNWNPPLEWLGFLTVWAGLDVAQFGAKRTTDASYVASKTAATAEQPAAGR